MHKPDALFRSGSRLDHDLRRVDRRFELWRVWLTAILWRRRQIQIVDDLFTQQSARRLPSTDGRYRLDVTRPKLAKCGAHRQRLPAIDHPNPRTRRHLQAQRGGRVRCCYEVHGDLRKLEHERGLDVERAAAADNDLSRMAGASEIPS